MRAQGNGTAGGPLVSSEMGPWAVPLPPATNVSLFPPLETEVNSTNSTGMNTEGMKTMTDIVTSTLAPMQETTGVQMEQNITATPTDVAATEDPRTPSDGTGTPSATTQVPNVTDVATKPAFTSSDATGTHGETTGTTARLTPQTPHEHEVTSTDAGETAGTNAAANDTPTMQGTTTSIFPTMLTPTTIQESTTITTGAVTTGRSETPEPTAGTTRVPTILPQSTASAQTTVTAQHTGTETTGWTTRGPTTSLQTTASGQTTARPETVLPNVTGSTAGTTREQTTQASPVSSSSPPTSPSRPVLFSHLPYISKPMVLPEGLDEFMGRIGVPKTSARYPLNLPTLARPVSPAPLRLG